jgi:Acyl-CoA reductase (LuxC)
MFAGNTKQSAEGQFTADVIIRGQVFRDNLVEFGGRGDRDFLFFSPDPHLYVDQLSLRSPAALSELHVLRFSEILDYLEELGARLDLKTNTYLQTALQGSYFTAPTTPPIIEYTYKTLHRMFAREVVREMAQNAVGIDYLEGWVPTKLSDGRTASVRAFGSRQLHIVAGNAPQVSAMTIIRNAISRSDSIIKTPSNDPFTALAIAHTMCDMAPDHPLTRHLSVAYWKGGDQVLEDRLYQPHNVEKIVAWGGLSSVRHVTKYIQPGLELIALDPKRSISVIGGEVFDSEESMRDAAQKLAIDFGVVNQVGCVCSRTAFVLSGVDDEGLEKLKQFGDYTYEAMCALPKHMSTAPRAVNPELKANIEAIRVQEDWYYIVGGEKDEGAVIVSLVPEPVNFFEYLENRTLNIVPVDDPGEVFPYCDAYTQTVGIYPENLKTTLRDRLPFYGVQRIASLGYATASNLSMPQDAIEPLRRSCKWIVDEQSLPEVISPLWPDVD